MPEPLIDALAVRNEPARAWTAGVFQGSINFLDRAGAWSVDVAQRFAAVLSAIMGPAVLVAYIFAAWSLASNMGWTGSFPYTTGPLSNSLIWIAIAIGVHTAADVLRRHTRPEK